MDQNLSHSDAGSTEMLAKKKKKKKPKGWMCRIFHPGKFFVHGPIHGGTHHVNGFGSLNCGPTTHLSWFGLLVPCGI